MSRFGSLLMILLCVGLVDATTVQARGGRKADNAAKLECKQAAEHAQQLRMDGQLLAARDELLVCSKTVCSEVVRSYCARWYEEVEGELPSIVVKVLDESANDLSDVTVTVDGEQNDSWSEGLPIGLDPGEHVLRFTRYGDEPQEVRVRLGSGEKNRLVAFTFRTGIAASDDTHRVEPEPDDEPDDVASPARGKRRAAWVMLGVSAASFGVGATMGFLGKRDLDGLRDTCAGSCAEDDVDRAWNKLIVADVAMGVGVVSAGLSTWLFVASRRERDARPLAGSTLLFAPRPGGAVAGFGSRF